MRREGGYLFVVTALIIGLGLGLLISLVISPVNYQNVSPSMLKPADKDLYRAMISPIFQRPRRYGARPGPAGSAGR